MIRKQPLIFYVEGNLGSGKTTLINKINRHFKDLTVSAYREPDDIWKASSLLQDFYEKPKQKAVSFQSFLAATFLVRDIHVREAPQKVFLLERSLFSASEVFLPLLLDCKYINLQEFLFLREINNTYIEKSLKADFHIYLNTNVETCLYRVKNRKNPGEGAVDYQYLTKIDNLHKAWFKQIDPHKVLEISSTQKDLDTLINKIETYIAHHDT